MNADTDNTREDLEIQKIRTENRKMRTDMEHDYVTLVAKIEQDLEQRYHWKRQQWYWIGVVILAALAILAAPIIKHYFPPAATPVATTPKTPSP